MTLSIDELGKRFWLGKESGRTNRTKIIERDKEILLVDYGWAVLAKRDKDCDPVTFYKGWEGYSQSTNRHISKANLRKAKYIKDERRQL